MTINPGTLLRALILLAAPLVLSSCLYLPGKFDSTLTVKADRSFTYAYAGEIIALDLDKAMSDSLSDESGGDEENSETTDSAFSNVQSADKVSEDDAKYQEIATALRNEAGYNKVEYRGGGKFWVEYSLSGKLTHNFVFPFNSDSAMIFPFVAIELRGKDAVRIKAPGFAKQENESLSKMGSKGKQPPATMDGTFTLITDAEIVSQNNEAGAKTENGMKVVKWRATPLTKDAPMAVLKLAGI